MYLIVLKNGVVGFKDDIYVNGDIDPEILDNIKSGKILNVVQNTRHRPVQLESGLWFGLNDFELKTIEGVVKLEVGDAKEYL